MKSLVLIAALALSGMLQAQVTTATNFTTVDCQGNMHDLFTELDTGCVVVLDWVMPCATCIGPSLTAYNIVQSYAATHPGRVRFYMIDDYANTTCTALTNWATANNMPGTTTFSDAGISMSDYGTAGMPKIVVLGGLTHNVYYNSNGAGNATLLQQAIDAALAETAVNEWPAGEQHLQAFADPLTTVLRLNFISSRSGKAVVNVFGVDGRRVAAKQEELVPGENVMELNLADDARGVYLVTVSVGDRTWRTRFIRM